MLAYQAVLLAFLVRYRPADPGVSGPYQHLYKWLAIGMGVGSIIVGVGLKLLWPWFGSGLDLAALLEGWGLNATTWWLFTAWLCVANPWLEQRFWRGLLGSPSIWPRATDGWFAGYHLLVIVTAVAWYWLPVVFVSLVASSWWWRQIIRMEGRFRVATLAHFAADASILVAIGLQYAEVTGGSLP
jgi:hypothetical protein